MKRIKFLHIVVLFIISQSCLKSSKIEPLTRLTKINDSNITYNNDGNPSLIGFGTNKIVIEYNSNKITKLIYTREGINQKNEVENRKITYLDSKKIFVESDNNKISYFDNKTLYFNSKGLLDSSKTTYLTDTYLNKYYYDSNENLIKFETIRNNKVGNFINYEKYDSKSNPFYEKAQLWSLILGDEGINLGAYMAFPISKNNPTIITLRNYEAGNKFKFSYNNMDLPIKIEEYFYKGLLKQPTDNDYRLEANTITFTY